MLMYNLLLKATVIVLIVALISMGFMYIWIPMDQTNLPPAYHNEHKNTIKKIQQLHEQLSESTGLDMASNLQVEEDTKSTKYVLLYTPFILNDNWYVEPGYKAFENCPVKNCFLTNNRSTLKSVSEYSALLFHDRNICVSKMPNASERSPDQAYVYALNESPINGRLDLHLDKYKSYFNWTMTYMTDSDIYFPYGFTVPRDPNLEYKTGKDLLKEKNKLIFVAQSNGARYERTAILEELSKYVNVTKAGKCYGKELSDEEYDVTLKQHKFYFALENTVCKDYVTEKFWRSLEYGLVPIVHGLEFHHKMGPGKESYIDIKDFASIKDLAEHLHYLDNNDEEYLKYFEWRKYFTVHQNHFTEAFCQICQKLHEPLEPKSYSNLAEYLEKDNCPGKSKSKSKCAANFKEITKDISDRHQE